MASIARWSAAAIVVSLGIVAALQSGLPHQVAASVVSESCLIKGNISLNTGERIYHVPGQEYYSETRISLHKGERWFCSEEEARKAGWRRARR
jgi:hypothetical protein